MISMNMFQLSLSLRGVARLEMGRPQGCARPGADPAMRVKVLAGEGPHGRLSGETVGRLEPAMTGRVRTRP